MRRWSVVGLLVGGFGVVGWLVAETRRLAELAGHHEHAAFVAVRAAREAAADDAERVSAAEQRAAVAEAAVVRLEGELAATKAQMSLMADTVHERAAAAQAQAAAAAEAEVRALEPMPEGVRECLRALHECLREEGFGAHRFVGARRLDGDGLHDVELLELAADGLSVSLVRAGRVAVTLDRGRGRLELRCFEGERLIDGNRLRLPDTGWPVVFEPVDGRRFEQRMPALLRCEGVYPEPVAGGRRRSPGELDPSTRLTWLERLDTLLAAAATPQRLRVHHLRGLLDLHFQGVQVLGTDAKNRLLLSAECQRLAVEVDESAGVVALLLRDGTLRRDGAESTIGAEGFRMLLPNVTPKQASDTMLGMVVRR